MNKEIKIIVCFRRDSERSGDIEESDRLSIESPPVCKGELIEWIRNRKSFNLDIRLILFTLFLGYKVNFI